MDILAGWGKVDVADCLESQLQRYSGYWADMEGQVGHLPESFGDLGPDAMSQLVASWPGGLTAFVETAGLHSQTLHLMSLLGQEKQHVGLRLVSFERTKSCCVFS